MVGCVKAEKSVDFDIIKRIGNDPAVYKHVSDDFSPEMGKWEPARDPNIIYLLAIDWELCQFVGFCAFWPLNAVLFDSHVAFLPVAYGARAEKAFRQMLNWMWANTAAQRIVGAIPDYNRHAIAFAERFGERFGYNAKAWSKGGQLCGLVLIGTSRP